MSFWITIKLQRKKYSNTSTDVYTFAMFKLNNCVPRIPIVLKDVLLSPGSGWANKEVLKLASASSSGAPSQGLFHVNKIVKHLLWHLLPLNIHKPVSTGKHPPHGVSWPSPSEYGMRKSVLCGTQRTWCHSFLGSLHSSHYSYESFG